MFTFLEADTRPAAQFLRKAYELEHAGRHDSLSVLEIGRQLGLGNHRSRSICASLAKKGLVEPLDSGWQFRLSQKGLDAVEWGFANPGFLHDLLCEELDRR